MELYSSANSEEAGVKLRALSLSGTIRVVFLALLCLSTACISHFPRVRKWENRTITLCCFRCDKAEWKKGIDHYCSGKSRLLGQEMIESSTGEIKSHYGQSIFDLDKDNQRYYIEKETETCQTYQCSTDLNIQE